MKKNRNRSQRAFAGAGALLLIGFVLGGAAAAAVAAETPHFKAVDGHRVFMVDGEPFLILGAQTDVWTMALRDEAAVREFAHVRALNCNLFEVPLRWAEFEPEKDRYDTESLKWIIDQGRSQGLKVALLWYGSNVGGTARGDSPRKKGAFTGIQYAPEYVFSDAKTYARVIDEKGGATSGLSPLDTDTLEREKRAFGKLCEFLKGYDREHTVVLLQVENEPRIVWTRLWKDTKMDHSAGSLEKYRREGWTDPDAYSIKQLALYIKELVDLATEMTGLPTYCNFIDLVPGQAETYLDTIPNLDLVGPDVYSFDKPLFGKANRSYLRFRQFLLACLDAYRFGRNVVYLSETGTDSYWRPHLSLFYVLGKYDGLGMTPWGITRAFPPRHDALINPKTGKPHKGGATLASVYDAVSRAMEPIALAQGTKRFAWCVHEQAGKSSHQVGATRVEVQSEPEGAALMVEVRPREILAVGLRCRLEVDTTGWGKVASETGAWKSGSWQKDRPVEAVTKGGRTTVVLGEPQVVRIVEAGAD